MKKLQFIVALVVLLFSFSLDYAMAGAEVDCGLRMFDGTSVVAAACESLAEAPVSSLKVDKNGNVYGIVLVDTTDSNATKFRIQTANDGVKAIKQFSTAPTPSVFIETDSGILSAWDEDGNEVWTFTHDSRIGEVTTDINGNIYTVTFQNSSGTGGNVRKIDINGNEIWKHQSHPGADTTINGGGTSIAVDSGGNVFSGGVDNTGSSKYEVVKLNSAGVEQWTYSGHTNRIYGLDVDASGNVFSGSRDRTLRKLNSAGAWQWTFNGHSADIECVVVDSGGYIITGSEDNRLKRIRPDGIEDWSYTFTGDVYGCAVDSNDDAYGGQGSNIKKLTSGGSLVWTFVPASASHTQALAIDGDDYIYAAQMNTNNEVVKIDPSGTEVWAKDIVLRTGAIAVFNGPTGSFSSCGDNVTYSGETYPTVEIGTQCWLAKNLNVGTPLCTLSGNEDGDNDVDTCAVEMTNNGAIEKYCMNNDENNCDAYGGLYQWDEAMAYSTTEGVQGICPSGWHFPTDAEWYSLEDYVGGDPCDADRCSDGAGSTCYASRVGCVPAYSALINGGSSGFNALLAGLRHATNGTPSRATHFEWSELDGIGAARFFTSSKTVETWGAWHRSLEPDVSTTGIIRNPNLKKFGFSIRCIKDTAQACGNGTTEAGEECDDGNTTSGDGCRSTCQWETKINTCPAKPTTGTAWNNVSSYTQTCTASNGSTCTNWSPSNDTTTSYSTSGSNTSCRYECANNYTYSGSACVADPTLSLSVNKSSNVVGESITVSWTVSGATSCVVVDPSYVNNWKPGITKDSSDGNHSEVVWPPSPVPADKEISLECFNSAGVSSGVKTANFTNECPAETTWNGSSCVAICGVISKLWTGFSDWSIEDNYEDYSDLATNIHLNAYPFSASAVSPLFADFTVNQQHSLTFKVGGSTDTIGCSRAYAKVEVYNSSNTKIFESSSFRPASCVYETKIFLFNGIPAKIIFTGTFAGISSGQWNGHLRFDDVKIENTCL